MAISSSPSPISSGRAGPSKSSAAEKWFNPLGPPPGSIFGARVMREDEDVYSQNAWDHVELPDDYHDRAAEIIAIQHAAPVALELRGEYSSSRLFRVDTPADEYNSRPAHYWNEFYSRNQAAFFKDRTWLRLEFPELIACSEANAGPKVVLEVGCGAGNSIFTLMHHNENPELVVYATDYSSTAIEVVKANPMYPCPAHGKGKLHASVWDITSVPPAPTALSVTPPAPPSSVTTNRHGTSRGTTMSLNADTTAGLVLTEPSDPIASIGPISSTSSLKSLRTTRSSTSPTSLAIPASPVLEPEPPNTPVLRPPPSSFALPSGLTPNSVDLITVIYVLSALHPLEWDQAFHNLYTALKPGGLLLIRDYGRHDLAQLRIRRDRLLDPNTPNLYIRGDGTRVYFFEKRELERLLLRSPRAGTGQMFEIDQLGEDRRMIVNRKEKKKMYRIWMQVKARKLTPDVVTAGDGI